MLYNKNKLCIVFIVAKVKLRVKHRKLYFYGRTEGSEKQRRKLE